MEVVKRRTLERKRVINELAEWASALSFKATAVLVGSYARGDFNLWSDVDVVLVAEFEGGPVERLKRLDVPVGVQVIPLTPREFSRLLAKRNPLAVEAVERGVVLRDDFGLFS